MPGYSIPRQELAGRWFVLATCFLLFIVFTSFYLLFPPGLASQPWDSLEYGYSIEAEGLRSIRGNHPLGHVFFYAVFALAKQLGYQGRALTTSQAINSILGGLIIAIFFAFLIFVIKSRLIYVLGFSLILAASYGFRFFAGTGDIYQFSILFSLLTWASLARDITQQRRSFPLLSGILIGLSILSHQLNVVLIPVGLSLMGLSPHMRYQTKKEKVTFLAFFLGSSTVVVVLGYLLLGFVATASVSPVRVIGWMRGFFGDPTYGRYLSAGSLKTAWLTLSQNVLLPSQDKFVFLSNAILTFLGIVMFLGIWMNKALDRSKRAILLASGLQCLISWPLILWWEPQNPKFWLLTLVPWMIFLALSVEAVETSLRKWLPEFGPKLNQTVHILPFVIGLILLTVNLRYPAANQNTAGFDQAMESWLSHSSPGDVLITIGDLIPQLRYWGNRPNTIFLYRSLQASQSQVDNFSALRAQINQALCSHHAVLIAPTASEYVFDRELSLAGVTREELRSYLNETARQGEILFWYRNTWDGKTVPVYALKRSAACSDQKSALE